MWFGSLQQRHHHRHVVAHVVAADLVRAVGQTARMRVAGRAQQQQRRTQRAAGDHDDVGGVAFVAPLAHAPARALTLRPDASVSRRDDIGVGQQREVGMRGPRGIDADHLRIGLGVDGARKAVERVAADARAVGGGAAVRVLVELDAERQMERVQPFARQDVVEFAGCAARARPADMGRARWTTARWGLRRAARARGTAPRPRCSTARTRRSPAARPARCRPCGAARRNRARAGAAARRHRPWSCRRRNNAGRDGTCCRRRRTRFPAPGRRRRRRRLSHPSCGASAAGSRRAPACRIRLPVPAQPLRQRRAARPAADDDHVVVVARRRHAEPCED